MNSLEFLFQLLNRDFSAKDLVRKPVDKCTESFSNSKGLFIADREVNLIAVDSAISKEAAERRKLFKRRGHIQVFELLSECLSLSSSAHSHIFKAGAKQGTRCSRRQANDGLRFDKEVSSAVRHIDRRGDATLDWINKLAINFECIASAVIATPKNKRLVFANLFGRDFFRENTMFFALNTEP